MQTARQVNEASADPYAMIKIIQKCTHCGDETTKDAQYCPSCRTASGRLEMCNENKEKIKSYVCVKCGIF